ncbi:MAG: phosphate acyltransferase PlsX [Gammaproteobacteria bacterium]
MKDNRDNNPGVYIAIDMMGGDFGLEITIPAVFMALSVDDRLHLILVGNQVLIEQKLTAQKLAINYKRISIVNCSQTVDMDDLPSVALRKKPDSSMRVALNLVKVGKAEACVSAGNTGALMAMARFVLKTLPGVYRPAILYSMPSKDRLVSILDLGANVDCSAEQLFQFAVMGSALVSALGKEHPSIGLLNIGSEAIKGTEAVKAAAILISNAPELNYFGFVEGDDLYKGTVDLIVCDGFVGNVALKVTEGFAKLILCYLKQGFTENFYSKLIGYLAKPILNKIFHKFNPNQYNGASLLGLNGIVIKSHGSADAKAFCNAILVAALEAEKNVPSLIREKVAVQLAGGVKVI